MPEKEDNHYLKEVFSSDLRASQNSDDAPESSDDAPESLDDAPESSVHLPCATNECTIPRRVYSKETLRALRHDRALAARATKEMSTSHRVNLKKDVRNKEENDYYMREVFGSDLGTSESSSDAPESNVPPPCATNECSIPRRVYSKETLQTLRHHRVLALPKTITKPLEVSRHEIPTLNPNEPTAFSNLSLPKELFDALSSLSLTIATPIQSTAIPFARLGGDLVAQATSGTGKTLTYAVVALDMILPSSPTRTAFIIVPTRELAYQVASLFSRLAAIRVITLVGGTKESVDESNLSKPANVIVGTPGRVEVMISRGAVDVSSIKVLVLDEADRLLDGSFGGSVERICNMIPTCQTLAFSATFSYSFRVSLMEVMREPKWIGGSDVIHSVVQRKVKCRDARHKIVVLKEMLQPMNTSLCLVFFNAKKAAGRLVRTLNQSLACVSKLVHAGITQKERDAVIREVRQGKVRVLVTTDVLARGIDFDSCDMVIHMDVPQAAETYLHRVGRAGRFGRKGSSTLLFDEADVSAVLALEADIGYDIKSPAVLDNQNVFSPIRPRSDGKNSFSNRDVSVIRTSDEDNKRNGVECPEKLTKIKVEALQSMSLVACSPLHACEDAVDADPADCMDVEKVTTSTAASEPVLANSTQKFAGPSPQINLKRVSQKPFIEQKDTATEGWVSEDIAEDLPSPHRRRSIQLSSVPPKRPRVLSEPATPAKKRKSARTIALSDTREAPIADHPRKKGPMVLNAAPSRNIPPRAKDTGSTDKQHGVALANTKTDAHAAGVTVLNEQSQHCDENMGDLSLTAIPAGQSRDSFTERCQEEWDRYAASAYDEGYREAYEEAFQVADRIRRHLFPAER